MTAKFDEDQRKKKDEEKNMISAPRYDKVRLEIFNRR